MIKKKKNDGSEAGVSSSILTWKPLLFLLIMWHPDRLYNYLLRDPAISIQPIIMLPTVSSLHRLHLNLRPLKCGLVQYVKLVWAHLQQQKSNFLNYSFFFRYHCSSKQIKYECSHDLWSSCCFYVAMRVIMT